MSVLERPSDKMAVQFPHFPDPFVTVIWRNWGAVSAQALARVLDCTVEQIRQVAGAMGLEPNQTPGGAWLKRGYLSTIRFNWHLLEYDQIMELIQVDEKEFAFLLKEDDFMWHKLGLFKPAVKRARYRPLTQEELAQLEKIPHRIRELVGDAAQTEENAFDFLDRYYGAPRILDAQSRDSEDTLRMVYSYFATYGDPLADEECDPFPEAVLAEYAYYGINGVWLQGILYQLTPYPFDPSLSAGWEKRIKRLNLLIQRAAKYGINIYLYLNEPRSMPAAFFDQYPELKGASEGAFHCMCTSQQPVKDYLRNASRELFQRAPGLGGFFTITMSENLTNCYSRSRQNTACPRCSLRTPAHVAAEVNNLLAEGAHSVNPNAKAIAWAWAWDPEWCEEVVNNLNQGQIVMSTSEETVKTKIGGVSGSVVDYSIPNMGPGEKSQRLWTAAQARGLETAAKMQINNTWELSIIPYIPVYNLIGEHVSRVKDWGVHHYMMSWTLGGCPSPNLRIAYEVSKSGAPYQDTVRAFIDSYYGGAASQTIYDAQQLFCDALREFPFHVSTLYTAPQNLGPGALLHAQPTDYRATMVTYPYDNVEGWRAIYPGDVFENQFRLLSDGWDGGIALLAAYQGVRSAEYDEFERLAQAAACHFRSAYNQIRFVRVRDALAAGPSPALKAQMAEILRSERALTVQLIGLRGQDSRIGFEASNQYNYTIQTLKEKLINIDYCEDLFA